MSSSSLPVFYSRIGIQRGAGIGNVLSRLFKSVVVPIFAKPGIRQGIRALGKAALSTGIQAAQKTLQEPGGGTSSSFKTALKESGKEQLQKLLRDTNFLREGSGIIRQQRGRNIKQSSTGVGRKRSRSTKKRKLDLFDFVFPHQKEEKRKRRKKKK